MITLPLVKIITEVRSCRECPSFYTANPWSSDGFDRMEDWMCRKADRTIKGAVEWHEVKKIEVPDGCPKRVDI